MRYQKSNQILDHDQVFDIYALYLLYMYPCLYSIVCTLWSNTSFHLRWVNDKASSINLSPWDADNLNFSLDNKYCRAIWRPNATNKNATSVFANPVFRRSSSSKSSKISLEFYTTFLTLIVSLYPFSKSLIVVSRLELISSFLFLKYLLPI